MSVPVSWVPLESSAMEAVAYNEDSATLRILFRKGYVYEFYVVPSSVYQEFLRATSKGRFFDEILRNGRFTWKRLERK